MTEPSKELLKELKILKVKHGEEALNAAYTSLLDLEPVVIDIKDLKGCFEGSYESRWNHISNLEKSAEGKKVNVTEEFKNGLYGVMISSEKHELCPMITCYLRLSQDLGIEYTSEELTRILFERPHRLVGEPYDVLENIIKMGAEIDPKKLAEWAGFSLAASIAKENLLGDKTEAFKKYFVELNLPRLTKEIKDTERGIEEYSKKNWFNRMYDKHVRIEDKLKHLKDSLEISKEYKSKLLDILFGYQAA